MSTEMDGAPIMYPDGSLLWLGHRDDRLHVQVGARRPDGALDTLGCELTRRQAAALGRALVAMANEYPAGDAPDTYSTTEAGRLLGMSRRRVIEQIEAGHLPAVRSSRKGWWRVSAEAITDWQHRHTSTQQQRTAATLRRVS